MDEVERVQTIGALSKATACQVETIRFYERIGLLPAPRRSPSGYRLYGRAHVTRLTFIRRARELGFSLGEVRTMLRLADERERPCAEVRGVASAHLRDVRAKIADLQAMERVLRATVARCARGTGSDCALIESLSRAAPTTVARPAAAPGRVRAAPS
jgi:MerR family mercuric resistance operon transcriptional regulator